jgi:hypothetical protein
MASEPPVAFFLEVEENKWRKRPDERTYMDAVQCKGKGDEATTVG